MVCGGGGRVVGGRRGGGQDADVHGRDSGDQGDHAQQPGEPRCILRGGRRGHVNQGIGSAYKYPYPLYVSVLCSCPPLCCPPHCAAHPAVLPTRRCCPPGGAAHSAVLPTRRCCPLGGAAPPAVLPTRRCCPPGCAAHSTALPTRRRCPLDGAAHSTVLPTRGAAHPRRCPHPLFCPPPARAPADGFPHTLHTPHTGTGCVRRIRGVWDRRASASAQLECAGWRLRAAALCACTYAALGWYCGGCARLAEVSYASMVCLRAAMRAEDPRQDVAMSITRRVGLDSVVTEKAGRSALTPMKDWVVPSKTVVR
ncbi:hypothetical protein APR09_000648 [Nocardia amikacinitolerans]|nr:hypothetical protein [Nocardia amikacinitolerans]